MIAGCKEWVDTLDMAEPTRDRTRRRVRSDEVDAVLAACRLLVGISVESLAAVDAAVNVTQLRILVVIDSRGVTTLTELAAATGLHLSRASRTCERLVNSGLVHRTDDPADRRSLRLTLTGEGRRIVAAVAHARRAAIEPVLRRMPEQRRGQLVSLLEEFTAAGGEPLDIHLWALGWAT